MGGRNYNIMTIIHFQSTIAVTSAGVIADVVELHGTSGTPIEATHTAIDPSDAIVSWLVAGLTAGGSSIEKGEIQKDTRDVGDAASYVSVDTGTDWIIPHNFSGTYYVRATLDADSAPTTGTLGTWLAVVADTNNVFWSWSQTTIGNITGTIKLEISNDISGVPLLATGFYKGTAIVDV